MRRIEDLIDVEEPAIELLRQWVSQAEVPCEMLSPSADRKEVLLALQVTTHSTLGALAYETGGILVDDGWLRLLGSGHSRLPRTLPDWNRGRADGYLLVGDDAAVYYWAPDCLDWECLQLGFTDFVHEFLTNRIAAFYEGLRWTNWRTDTSSLSGDRCFSFYPFLWTKEGSVEESRRAPVPVSEAFDLKVDIVRQLTTGG